MPVRPKPGAGQGRRMQGDGIGAIVGAALGAPDVGASSVGGNFEGPNEGSGEGTGAPPARGVMTKPSFAQGLFNPQLNNIYYQNQGAMGLQGLQGTQALEQISAKGGQERQTLGTSGEETRKTLGTEGDIQQKAALQKHVLDVASRLEISPENVPALQQAMYPDIFAANKSKAKAGSNIAHAQEIATGTPDFQAATNAGANARAGMDSADYYSKTRTATNPGEKVGGFFGPNSAPTMFSGPSSVQNTSSVTTRGPASDKYPQGIPMGGSSTVTGNTFGGGSFPASNNPTSFSDIFNQWNALQSKQDTTSTQSNVPPAGTPPDDRQEEIPSQQGNSIMTKPNPQGSLGQLGGSLQTILQYLRSKGIGGIAQ